MRESKKSLSASSPAKFIKLGHPSYLWRRGQERRLRLLQRHVVLDGLRMLDVGCGIGTYVQRLREFSDDVYGVDVDLAKVDEASEHLPNIQCAAAESLPFADDSFDLVLLNEVIEHVDDDRAAIREAVRCVRPNGVVVIYAPNRLYPFETHGFYLGDRFIFRLLPGVNYLPNSIRNRFCPHVRIYTQSGIKSLFDGLNVTFQVCSHIYPGLDNVRQRHAVLGRLAQWVAERAEGTPLRALGISHFVVARKRPPSTTLTGAGQSARFRGPRIATRVGGE